MLQNPHVSEYHDSMVAFLEWIWGRDYMAPGGEGNVDKLVKGLDLAGKRVLGVLTCYDWLKGDGPISDDMQYFFKMEGLTYNLITLEELARYLKDGGFVGVTTEDASDWYRRESHREYELMRGEGRPRAVELIDEAQAAHMIEDWRSLVVVCDKGELRQGYTRGYKPR